MKYAFMAAVVFVALLPAVKAQAIDNQTFAQSVESANGLMPGSVRAILKDSSHIFVASPPSQTGHSYLSFNSLGKSPLTPAQVMNAIKADPGRAFPFFNADGECGSRVRRGNTYSLNISVAGYRPIENPVRVTGLGSYHFTFSTLPGHTLQGSATHGVFKDRTGELWLFQVGKGVFNEDTLKQKFNCEVAEKMWSQMADNVRDMMGGMKPSDQLNVGSDDYVFGVNGPVNTGIPIRRGDTIKLKASGTVKFGYWLAGSGDPEGIPFNPDYNYFNDVLHGSLLGRVRAPGPNTWEGWFYIGRGREIVAQAPGVLEFEVNDNRPEDNEGKFCVEVTIVPARR